VGCFVPAARMLWLRGIGVRQHFPVIGREKYTLSLSPCGRFLRGTTKEGLSLSFGYVDDPEVA
jgi:hypothetical protein